MPPTPPRQAHHAQTDFPDRLRGAQAAPGGTRASPESLDSTPEFV